MLTSKSRLTILTLVLFIFALALPLNALAHGGHGHQKPAKKAILLVTFGTSVPEAQKVFTSVDQAFKKAFPGVEVRWAYTAKIVRDMVAKKQGKTWLSPSEALAKLMSEGYTHVAVQSLHVIPGAEFHDLVAVVHGFARMSHGFKVLISYPLCSTVRDLKAVVGIVAKNLPKGAAKDDAVVFMGHGTHHPAGVVYAAIAYMLQQEGDRLLMGTVEGYPSLDDVVAQLKAKKVKKAYLLPFMTVAGDHAMNDMAGPEPDSWKSILEKNGIKAVPVMRPITALPAVVDIFIKHAKHCFEHLK